MNRVAESLTGWQESDALDRPLEDVFCVVSEQSRAPIENPAMKALRAEKVVELTNPALLIAKDGTERPLEDSAAPIRAANGTITGAVLVFRDVTDRKNSDEELRASEFRLRQLASDLSVADRRKNEFLAMLAHELRNPLAPIKNALTVIRLTSGKASAVDEASAMMERQVAQLTRLVDDFARHQPDYAWEGGASEGASGFGIRRSSCGRGVPIAFRQHATRVFRSASARADPCRR